MSDKRVVFMGTPEFSVPVLEKLIKETNVVLVVTKKDAYVGRKHILTPSPVKKFASEKGIEVYTPEKLKNEYEYILEKKPDIIITCAYGQIVPKIILDYPKYGCINVHASLLPKYRGSNPINQAIYNGDKKTGITIMYMDETLDTGDIIKSDSVEILDDDNLGTLSNKLSILGANLLLNTLPLIFNNTNDRIPQNHAEATFTKMISRDDEILDFNRTKREVYNHIRSLSPSPLTNIKIGSEEIKIVSARIGDDSKGEVGIISDVLKDAFSINCSDGRIDITRIKPAGKKEMDVRDYLNGIKKENLLNKKVGENFE